MSVMAAEVVASWPAMFCSACHWTGTNLAARWCPDCDRTEHAHRDLERVTLTVSTTAA